MADARWLVLAGAILMLLVVLLVQAPSFFSWANLRGMAVDAAPKLVLAGGMTLVILAGQIDVSIGAQIAACGAVLGIVSRTDVGMPGAVLASLGTGAAIGLLNGWLVARAKMPAILATLAMLAVLRGSLRWASGGEWIQRLPASFQWYGLGQASGQIAILAAALALFLLLAFFLARTRPGRAIPATGCDPEAVRRAGVDPERVVQTLFVAMGALSGLAAALWFPRYPAVEIEAGAGLELEVIACVVLGGTAIRGGRGSFGGTLLGVVLLALLGTALVFLRVDVAWERAIQGSVLLAAVMLDAIAGERSSVRHLPA